MNTTIRYIFLTAIRDWLFIGLAAAILLAVGMSFFLGGTALVEQMQMTIVYASGSSRVILIIGLIVFVCFHVRRAFDNREVEVILTRPISRSSFVFSYWAGFAILSFLVSVPLTLLLGILLDVNFQGLLFWGASLVFESFIVVAFALACSLILQSAVSSVFVSFGFYFISRMMGFFVAIIDKPSMVRDVSWSWIMENILTVSSMILPRLDLFGKSKWLVYGVGSDVNLLLADLIPIFIVQSVIYVPLLLFMAIYDFKRRQF
jgi:ABC-type transport system involved in multi-copper enzyme maturation permease subunit